MLAAGIHKRHDDDDYDDFQTRAHNGTTRQAVGKIIHKSTDEVLATVPTFHFIVLKWKLLSLFYELKQLTNDINSMNKKHTA